MSGFSGETHVRVRGKRAVGIEVKAGARWREEYGRALAELRRAGVPGDHRL